MRFVMLLLAAVMAAFVAASIVVQNADAAGSALCWSTGDPHYTTFSGHYYDMYGRKGDYVLARSDDGALDVQTRIAFRRQQFLLRGLNAGLFVRLDGVTLEYGGSQYIWLNRKKYTLSQVETNKAGVSLTKYVKFAKDSKGQFVLSSTKSGFTVGFTAVSTGSTSDHSKMTMLQRMEDPLKYFNVFVSAPEKYKGKMTGLCGPYEDKDTDAKCLAAQLDCMQLGSYSSFHRKLPFFDYETEKQAQTPKAAFDNKKAKKAATKSCKKRGLKGGMLRACIADMKAVGHKSATVAKMYKSAAKALKRVKKQAKKVKKAIKKRKLVKKALKKLKRMAARGNSRGMQKLMGKLRRAGALGKVMHKLKVARARAMHHAAPIIRRGAAMVKRPVVYKPVYLRRAVAAAPRPVFTPRFNPVNVIRRASRGARVLGRRHRRALRKIARRAIKIAKSAGFRKIKNGKCPCLCPARAPRRHLVAQCPVRGRPHPSKSIGMLDLFNGLDLGQKQRCGNGCRARYVHHLDKAIKIYRKLLKML